MDASFHIEHFGCRAARADGEAIADRLRAAGLSESQPALADVVVVNTCSVTAEADRAARAFIRRAHRLNPTRASWPPVATPSARLRNWPRSPAWLPSSATATRPSLRKSRSMPGRKRTVGHCARTPDHPWSSIQFGLRKPFAATTAGVLADDRFAHSFLEEAQLVPGTQTRPNLKIQEGCGNRCTFCVIPQTRGSSRSLLARSVLARSRIRRRRRQ